MERYLTGLLTDLPHKTADTIAAAVAGTSTERLQHLLTDAAWDATALDEARVKRLLAIHPPTSGVLVFDDTGLPKKGTESVGVEPQYSGTLGKIGNCQVVVSAEYLADDPASSTPFHWPVSAQLFVPESWVADAERRKRTHVPTKLGEQSKPEIALGLLDRARAVGGADPGGGGRRGLRRQSTLRGRTRRPPGALRLCRTKHLWGALARGSAGGCAERSPPMAGEGSRASRDRHRCTRSKSSSMRSRRKPGRPSSGGRGPKARCGRRCWRCASTGPPVRRATAPATAASTPGQKAGCSPSAPCPYPRVKSHPPTNRCHQPTPRSRKSPGSKKPRRSSTGSARCRLRPRL